MAKRNRPWENDFDKQVKMRVDEKIAFKNDPEYMARVYARTNALLFQGANRSQQNQRSSSNMMDTSLTESSTKNHNNLFSEDCPMDLDLEPVGSSYSSTSSFDTQFGDDKPIELPPTPVKERRVLLLKKNAKKLTSPSRQDLVKIFNRSTTPVPFNLMEKPKRTYSQLHIDGMLQSIVSEETPNTNKKPNQPDSLFSSIIPDKIFI